MTDDFEVEQYKRLEELRKEHRKLEHTIHALTAKSPGNEFEVRRHKKEKLSLRDQIMTIEADLYPDIIA